MVQNLAPAAQAGGIDQGYASSAPLEIDVDGVTRGTRHVEGDDTLLTQQRVDQRALADVRTSGDGDLDDAIVPAHPLPARIAVENEIDKMAHTFAMRGRDAAGFAEAEFVEVGGSDAAIESFRFIDGDMDRSADSPQLVGDLLVLRGDSVRPSTTKMMMSDSAIACSVWRAISCMMPSFASGSKPPVSTTRKGFAQLAVAVMAVAGQAGNVGDQRITALGEAIEERRLSDVGSADQGNRRLHRPPVPSRHPCVCKTTVLFTTCNGAATGDPSVLMRGERAIFPIEEMHHSLHVAHRDQPAVPPAPTGGA